MRKGIGSGWFVVAAVAACHSGSVNDSAPAEAGPTRSKVDSVEAGAFVHHRHLEGDGAVDPLCATLLKEEKIDESALKDEDKTSPGPRAKCFSTGTYAWMVRADRGDAGSSIRQTVLFAGPDGARGRSTSTVADVEWPPVLGRRAAMFDFDGDGVPEFFSLVTKDVRTFTPASRIFVTYKKGAIAPYPTGGAFLVDGLHDVDRDGRPDLRVSFDLGKRTTCAPTDEGRVEVELIARSLPDGKFSLTDPAALGYAVKRCRAMPTPDQLFTRAADPAQRDLSISAIACARMRGKSAEAVIADLNAACAPNADATKKCQGPCRHLPDALAAARFTPPVQLK